MMLENKLDIDDPAELAREEERISKRKAVVLYESGVLDSCEPGAFETLALIHRVLFGDVYAFAGQMRTVNSAKGNFRFAPVMYLSESLRHISEMPQTTFEEIIEKYVEIEHCPPVPWGQRQEAPASGLTTF